MIWESIGHSQQQREVWRANVEVSRLSKWKRGTFINKHQVHWGREAGANVWFGGMIEQQWEQDHHHQQSPAFEGVPTMLGTENPCGDSCPSATTGPQAGQSQRDYSRTWDVRGEVFLVRDARGWLVWHKDKYFWAFMGSENPQPGSLQRKNRIFCRLCLPSNLLKFQKVATQSGRGVEASQSRPPHPLTCSFGEITT